MIVPPTSILSKRSLCWIAPAVAGFLFIAGCSQSQTQPKQLEEVRLGTFSVAVDYGAYLVAKQKGWFDEALAAHGAKAHYEVFQSLPPLNESIASNRVDVVLEAEPPALAGEAAGVGLHMVGVSCSVPVEIIVPKESPIHNLKQLKGKKIAVLAGTSSHYGLLKTLERVKLLPSAFQVIDMTPPDAKNAFETGKVDAWSVWSPWVEQETVPDKGRDVPGGDAVVYSIIVARDDFTQQHADQLNDILAVMQRSKTWVQANGDEAVAIIAKEMGIPVNIIQTAWPKHNWKTQVDQPMITDIQAKADFLLSAGFIKKPIDVQNGFVSPNLAK